MSEGQADDGFRQWRVEPHNFQPIWSDRDGDAFHPGNNPSPAGTAAMGEADSGPSAAEQEQQLLQRQINEAYQRGFDEGQKVSAQANAELTEISQKLHESIGTLKPVLSDQLCEAIILAISALLERTASFAVPDADLLRQRCEALARVAHRELSKAQLFVHPEDRVLIGETDIGLPLVDDPQMMRGTLRIAHDDGFIEQGTQPVLDELAAMLDELELTR
ncbi:MAG: hypothetical protein AAFX04_10525 [Pseudomonadota bacterium]